MSSVNDPMSLKSYDRVTIAFHWLTVALVAFLLGTAWLWRYTPREWHLHRLEGLHMSFGIVFAVVVVARLLWRALAGRRLPAANSGLMDVAARAVHWLLYALLALEAALGIFLGWLNDEGKLSFFGLFDIPNPFTPDRATGHALENLHDLTAWAIAILVVGHAGAALFHHYVLKDRLLNRMSPAGTAA